jgi:uncharacterized protein YukE
MSILRAAPIVLGLWVIGCSHKAVVTSSPTPTPVAAPEDPEHKLYDQLRKGAFQISAATQDLSDGAEAAEKLEQSAGGTASKGFKDVVAKLNTAGTALAEYASAPDSYEEFAKDVNDADDRRLNAISAATDALDDVGDAQDVVDQLLLGAPADAKPKVQKIQDQLEDAVDALQQGIEAMGGKVEEDPDTNVPGSAPDKEG